MELYQLNFHQRLLLPSFWREMLRGGVSPSEGGVQVVSRETSQQILSLFGVRGCSKWKYDVVENGGQPSSLHVLFVGPRVFLLYIDQCHRQQEAGL